jgi:hypothetical protein
MSWWLILIIVCLAVFVLARAYLLWAYRWGSKTKGRNNA